MGINIPLQARLPSLPSRRSKLCHTQRQSPNLLRRPGTSPPSSPPLVGSKDSRRMERALLCHHA